MNLDFKPQKLLPAPASTPQHSAFEIQSTTQVLYRPERDTQVPARKTQTSSFFTNQPTQQNRKKVCNKSSLQDLSRIHDSGPNSQTRGRGFSEFLSFDDFNFVLKEEVLHSIFKDEDLISTKKTYQKNLLAINNVFKKFCVRRVESKPKAKRRADKSSRKQISKKRKRAMGQMQRILVGAPLIIERISNRELYGICEEREDDLFARDPPFV